jgi:hypothetical protein
MTVEERAEERKDQSYYQQRQTLLQPLPGIILQNMMRKHR